MLGVEQQLIGQTKTLNSVQLCRGSSLKAQSTPPKHILRVLITVLMTDLQITWALKRSYLLIR